MNKGFYVIYLTNIGEIKCDNGISYHPISVFPSYTAAKKHIKEEWWIQKYEIICVNFYDDGDVVIIVPKGKDGWLFYYGKIDKSGSFVAREAFAPFGPSDTFFTNDYSALPYFRSS